MWSLLVRVIVGGQGLPRRLLTHSQENFVLVKTLHDLIFCNFDLLAKSHRDFCITIVVFLLK